MIGPSVVAAAVAGLAVFLAVTAGGQHELVRRGIAGPRRFAFGAEGEDRAPVTAFSLRTLVSAASARRGARARVRRETVIEVCVSLAAELRSGVHPAVALERVSRDVPGVVDEAAALGRLGGDVPAAFQRAGAATAGSGGLGLIGACWSVAERTGSALAPACDRVAETLRHDEALRREVTAQLAGARASARLMAGLPVLGLLLGASMGARPLDVLLGSSYGLVCLVSGALLAAAGVAWTERLARTVEDEV